ncbi:MAG TPA: tetratricopeptide repeat protein, partial [Pseudomonadales bacterium]|nr:tetratricopeptide repeat protein [Pseudomonadales bacterium]
MWCETAEKTHPLNFFWPNKRISAQVICFLLFALFIRSSLAENNNAPSAASELSYQNLLFYYEQGNYLETLVRAPLQAQLATQDTRQKDRQILFTRAYLQAGLFDEAENSLRTIPKNAISNEENNEVLLSLAKHYADQQNMTALNNTLQQLRPSQSAAQNNQKNYLLARYFFAQANYSASSLAFADITKNAVFYPYTRYNLAMSQLKNNQAQQAETTLVTLLNTLDPQPEHASLRSRCSLALGQLYLQTGQYEKAREVLGQIESNGIDSNAALLGLGRSYQLLGQNDKALAAWQALSQQDDMDSSVQHALLWIAMHYENTQEQNQAVSAYQHAINRYHQQLQALQQSQQGLKDST